MFSLEFIITISVALTIVISLLHGFFFKLKGKTDYDLPILMELLFLVATLGASVGSLVYWICTLFTSNYLIFALITIPVLGFFITISFFYYKFPKNGDK